MEEGEGRDQRGSGKTQAETWVDQQKFFDRIFKKFFFFLNI